MSIYEHLKLSTVEGVAAIVLNRPPLNVMNIAMMREINSGLEALPSTPGLKVLVIKAEGKMFSAGVDVADHTADKVDNMMKEFHRTFELLNSLTILSVAVVDGAALGGGCELAISCDIVIASERAKFGQPEIKVGVFPPIAAAIFPRLVGRNRTLELLMSGGTISATEAERIGLINAVVPAAELHSTVRSWAPRRWDSTP